MTRLINKNNFKIIETNKPSTYSKNEYVECNIVFETDGEGNEILPIPYYTASLTVEDVTGELFQECIAINEYDQSQKDIVDAASVEYDRIEKFKGFKILITIDYEYAFLTYKDLLIYCIAKDSIKKETNGVSHVYLNTIHQANYDLIKDDINVTIECVDDILNYII